MTPLLVGVLSIGAMVLLIYLGLHVPIALALSSFVGVWLVRGSPELASRLLAIAAEESVSSYIFGVVPLFVLMGLVVSEAGLGRDSFDVASRGLRRVNGGLGVATVMSNAIFAAITGISIASAAIFSRIAVPEMRRNGYSARFSVGVVAGSSVLGMLIPPSLLLILYGVLSERSVGKLFLAGILPGILLAVSYSLAIVLAATYFPRTSGVAKGSAGQAPMPFGEAFGKLAPIVFLIVLVLGGIYGGIFTPTEAGAVGSFGAIAVAAFKRRLTWKMLWRVTKETGHITAAVLFLIMAANMYSRMLALSGVPGAASSLVVKADFGAIGFIAIVVLVCVMLGTLLDSSSIMMVLLPLVLPIATHLGIDLIWFGIIVVIAIEIGLLTPPLGLSVYVIKGTLEDQSITLNDIFAGALPFAALMLLVLALVIMFPWLSLALT